MKKQSNLAPPTGGSMLIKQHINLLGLPVQDRITGIKGVVTSVCFDLFGCVQAAIHPGADKDGKMRDVHWRSEEHTSELQSHLNLVCRLLLEKKNTK